jgi:DNA-binding XRE family transcriptional regulator
MKKKIRTTTDALEIMDLMFFQDQPELVAEFENMRADDAVARKIYALRTRAGLSQRALAKLIGTTASVICRLEDADYEGHSLAMLNRIAAALHKRVEIRFVPMANTSKKKAV